MISRNDVIEAYQLILGRNPENEIVIDQKLLAQDVTFLWRELLLCDEFRSQPSRSTIIDKSFYEPFDVQLNLTASEMHSMLERTRGEWRKLGEEAPHWSVLTHDTFLPENVDKNLEAFYRSGETEVLRLSAALARAGFTMPQGETRALELGCGLGRITEHISAKTSSVVAFDISKSHLELALRRARALDVNNVEYKLLSDPIDLEHSGLFDLFFSVIVLQHNPPPIMVMLLLSAFKALKRGGFAYFQIPTFIQGYRFSANQYLTSKHVGMEMHALPLRHLLNCLREGKMRLLDFYEDGQCGSASITSMTFLCCKE